MTTIRINIDKKEQPKQFYRVPHDIERFDWNSKDFRYGGDGYVEGPVRNPATVEPQPEVYRYDPDHHVVLDCGWQLLWRNLNPKLSALKWSKLLGNGLAWCNGSGFPGHHNCILHEEVTQDYPRFDQARTCGGAILTGEERDGLLYIETLKISQSIPSVEEVMSKPWLWYWGTSINPEGNIRIITREGMNGSLYGVIIPNLTEKQVTLPLNELDKLPLGQELPSPTWLP
jgi:hypothetical protein